MRILWNQVLENVVFVMEFAAVVAVLFLVAYGSEKLIQAKHKTKEKILTTKKIAMIGMFSAVSAVLMLFELPMPFAPSFYKLDFSELPVLICTFAFGPVAGVMTEFLKIFLKLLFKQTTTVFVGELANFAVGCSFILPSSIIYLAKKNRHMAIYGCIAGTLCMTVFGSSFNAVYLLPKFAEIYGMPLDQIIKMGTSINPSITSVTSFVLWAVAPLNLLKGSLVSVLTVILYKKLSPILKSSHHMTAAKQSAHSIKTEN